MTKEEQNQIIKDAWVRNLQKDTDIPDNIGETYKDWVRGLVMTASQQLTADAQQTQAQQEQEAS